MAGSSFSGVVSATTPMKTRGLVSSLTITSVMGAPHKVASVRNQ